MGIKLRNMTSLYLVREGEILCLYRIGSRVANNKYVGAAGGHFEPEELNDPEACILREMKEELGLLPPDVEDLTLRYITIRLIGARSGRITISLPGWKKKWICPVPKGISAGCPLKKWKHWRCPFRPSP
jgi:8-oxo-dGTP pyrophosphatase MutT (NUDIX family)